MGRSETEEEEEEAGRRNKNCEGPEMFDHLRSLVRPPHRPPIQTVLEADRNPAAERRLSTAP